MRKLKKLPTFKFGERLKTSDLGNVLIKFGNGPDWEPDNANELISTYLGKDSRN